MSKTIDPFQLSRFLEAQQSVYPTALAEIKAGEKRTHWMWFIFPQLTGMGSSDMSRRYAIQGLDEAQVYLRHPLLGERLRECANALLSLRGHSATQIFGFPDDAKLCSSMTLFALAAGSASEFDQVLERYFKEKRDERTLALLESNKSNAESI